MRVARRIARAATGAALGPGISVQAASRVVCVDAGTDATTAARTPRFPAALTGLGLAGNGGITLDRSDSGAGGFPDICSGCDPDATIPDIDGDAGAGGAQFPAASLPSSAGSIRPGGTQPPSTCGGPTTGRVPGPPSTSRSPN